MSNQLARITPRNELSDEQLNMVTKPKLARVGSQESVAFATNDATENTGSMRR